jgi:pentatricopeptide repeat protein
MKASKVRYLNNLRGCWNAPPLKDKYAIRNFCFIPAVPSASESGTLQAPVLSVVNSAPSKPVKTIPYRLNKKKDWSEVGDQFAEDYKKIMKSRDFEAAMELYGTIKNLNTSSRTDVLTGLLLVCTKKHHLSSAVELFNELSKLVNQPSETAYMSLIRCYSDNGQIDVALSLIEEMKRESVELKLRNYHPILEAAVSLRDFDNSVLTIKQMIAETLIPRSDHFILMLEAAAMSGAFERKGDIEIIDKLLCDSLVDLSDMDHNGLIRILSAIEDISEEEAEEEGTLMPSHLTYEREREVEEEEEADFNRRTPLRLVHISNRTSCCPNCRGQLKPLCLNVFDREMVRQGLLNMTTTQFAPHHTRNMKVRSFTLFLCCCAAMVCFGTFSNQYSKDQYE